MMTPLVALFGLRLLSCFNAAASQGPPKRVPEVVAQYDFTKSSCVDTFFPNLVDFDTLSTLSRNEDATLCSSGMGVENVNGIRPGSRVLSTRETNAALLDNLAVSNNGVTFELWFKPHIVNETHPIQPILSLGKHISGVRDPRDCGNADLQISQRAQYLQIHYRTSDPFFVCQHPVLVALPLEANKIVHLVFALDDKQQTVYINGQPNPHNRELIAGFSPSMDHWNREYGVHFFSDNLVNNGGDDWIWNGTVYRFAVYGKILSELEARQNFAAGLPSTLPFAISQTIELNEDAEIDAGSHAPEWYSRERNATDADVPQISLSFGHIDTEVYESQRSHGITEAVEPHKPGIFITRTPEQGQLFQLDGTRIFLTTRGPEPVRDSLSSSVIFIPEKDEFSFFESRPYATFLFCVSVSEKYDASTDCDPGTIEIMVNAVNDPPIFNHHPVYNISSGVSDETTVFLSGMDVDPTDEVNGAIITSFPIHGELFLTNSRNQRYESPLNATSNNATIASPVVLGYRFTGSEDIVASDGTIASDSFTYVLFDSSGMTSEEGAIEIDIHSALVVQDSTINVLEDTDLNFVLNCSDMSGWNRNVTFEILSVPSVAGVFHDPENKSKELSHGSFLAARVAHPHGQGAPVHYQPKANFFNFPTVENHTVEATFVFRAVVLDEFNEIESASAEASVDIIVRNVNDQPILTVSLEHEHSVEVKRTLNWNGELCDMGAIHNATMDGMPHGCLTVLLIDGITLSDPDSFVDRVRVDLKCNSGVFALNPKHRDKAEFVSCGHRNESTWQCQGNPFGSDHNLTFLALPGDVNDILSSLHFWSHITGPDEVLVSVHDGIGEECPTPQEQSFHRLTMNEHSLHPNGCTVASKTIPIQVRPLKFRKEYKLKRSFPQDIFEGPKDVWVAVGICLLSLLYLMCMEPSDSEGKEDEEESIATAETGFEDDLASSSVFAEAASAPMVFDSAASSSFHEAGTKSGAQSSVFDESTSTPLASFASSNQPRNANHNGSNIFPDLGHRGEWDNKSFGNSDSMDSLNVENPNSGDRSNTAVLTGGPNADGISPRGVVQPGAGKEMTSTTTVGAANDSAAHVSTSTEGTTVKETKSYHYRWVRYIDPATNKPYFYNTETEVVTWTKPADKTSILSLE